MFKYILKPDYTKKGIQYNHIASKLLVPSSIITYYTNQHNFSNYSKLLTNQLFVGLCGIHSYVSTANIITDYIKNNKFQTLLRSKNIAIHSASIIGYSYYFLKKYC